MPLGGPHQWPSQCSATDHLRLHHRRSSCCSAGCNQRPSRRSVGRQQQLVRRGLAVINCHVTARLVVRSGRSVAQRVAINNHFTCRRVIICSRLLVRRWVLMSISIWLFDRLSSTAVSSLHSPSLAAVSSLSDRITIVHIKTSLHKNQLNVCGVSSSVLVSCLRLSVAGQYEAIQSIALFVCILFCSFSDQARDHTRQ